MPEFGAVQPGAYGELVQIAYVGEVAADIANVIHFHDGGGGKLMLDTEVIGDDLRGGENFGPCRYVGREEAGRTTARSINVAIEDIRYVDEWGILRLRADLIRSHAVIENAEPRAQCGLAISEHIVTDTDARAPVVPVGGGSRRRADRRTNALGMRRHIAADGLWPRTGKPLP